MERILAELEIWFWSIVTLGVAVTIALAIHFAFFTLALRAARRTRHVFDESLLRHARGPVRLILPVFALRMVAPRLEIPEAMAGAVAHGLSLALIAAVAWLAVRFTRVLDDVTSERYRVDIADDRTTTVDMTLTTPNCPSAQELPAMVENAVASVPGVGEVKVDIVWDPPWDQTRMSDEAPPRRHERCRADHEPADANAIIAMSNNGRR